MKAISKRPKPKRQAPKVNDKIYNIYHPELEDKVEEAFKSGGTTYYNFKRDTEIRTGRYMVIQNFLQEVFFRMDLERLKLYIKRIREEIDGSKDGKINVGNACAFLDQMKNLTELAFEPDTVYRLASAVFFDNTEDLRTWDKQHNEIKIQGWKEDGTLDFFYRMAFSELIGLKSISETDMRDYLEKVARLSDEYKRVLSSEVQPQ